MKRALLLLALTLLALATGACTLLVDSLRTVVGSLPAQDAPLGGQIAALPTPVPGSATATPPPSLFILPTEAPTMTGPLATLTAIAGLIPTQDLSATPYAIELNGRPHFVEFQARW